MFFREYEFVCFFFPQVLETNTDEKGHIRQSKCENRLKTLKATYRKSTKRISAPKVLFLRSRAFFLVTKDISKEQEEVLHDDTRENENIFLFFFFETTRESLAFHVAKERRQTEVISHGNPALIRDLYFLELKIVGRN